MEQLALERVLAFGNLILSSINVILAFSLLVYILTHNLRNTVARSFSSLLAFVTIVHAADVVLLNVSTESAKFFWLKFQWLGIAFIPAAYLHFSDALLRTTNSFSRLRRGLVIFSYLLGALFFSLTIRTALVVWDGVHTLWVTYFRAGPLFWAFAFYFFLVTGWGVVNTFRARHRTLTPASRRRMTYLTISFVAPALGAFPYLLLASLPTRLSPIFLLSLSLVGSAGIALMTVILGYSVAYHGVLMPDRVVKRRLINYLLRGPLVGSCLLILMLVIPRVESILGLPRDTVLIFATVLGIVLLQVTISAARPLIDLLVYRRDRAEVARIRELEDRLLTTTDLQELLQNILAALCDLSRVRTGFVVTPREDGLHLEAFCGSQGGVDAFLESEDPIGLLALPFEEGESQGFMDKEGFWLLPLRTKSREGMLGVLGVEARQEELTEREEETVRMLVHQAELALEDRQLQQGVFAILDQIAPEIQSIQRWRSTPRYVGSAVFPPEESPIYTPDFNKVVKEALAHYWGGPKLLESPLLKMGIVQRALAENGYVPTKALRLVLRGAIEALKPPEEERSLAARGWVLYNILEMKFIRGWRMRDIAQRLAMSESDLYRKQRVAIDAVARVLIDMEGKSR